MSEGGLLDGREAVDTGAEARSLSNVRAGRIDHLFAINLRRRREAQGKTQAEVAEQMRERDWSWHPQTVQRVETGQRKVTIGEANAIAEILDTTADQLTWPDQVAFQVEWLDASIAAAHEAWAQVAERSLDLLLVQEELAGDLAVFDRDAYRNLDEVQNKTSEGHDALKIGLEGAVESARRQYGEMAPLDRMVRSQVITGHAKVPAMTIIGWMVNLPNRDPSPGGLLAGAATGTLDGALSEVRREFPAEKPEETWWCEVNGRPVRFGEFRRLANTPGAAGRFVMSGPNGMTVSSRNAGSAVST